MPAIRAVTVFCSSSPDIAPAYLDAGRALAAGIAGRGWTLVYGGNHVGLMGAAADAARAAGGRVVGITPQLFVDRGLGDHACDELVVTADMGSRKALLAQRADAFVALPGGLGTYEELFEVLVGRQLGYHAKPIVLVDTGGYYQPLLAMLSQGVETRFVRPAAMDLFRVVPTAEAAIDYLVTVDPLTPSPVPDVAGRRPPSGTE